MSTINLDPLKIYRELEQAIYELNIRGLFKSAQWAAEQLVGLGLEEGLERTSITTSEENHPKYLLARSHFNFKEYLRAFQTLKGVGGRKALFLRNYSLYLAGERKKEEERLSRSVGGGIGRGGGGGGLGGSGSLLQETIAVTTSRNPYLSQVESELLAGMNWDGGRGGGGRGRGGGEGKGDRDQKGGTKKRVISKSNHLVRYLDVSYSFSTLRRSFRLWVLPCERRSPTKAKSLEQGRKEQGR